MSAATTRQSIEAHGPRSPSLYEASLRVHGTLDLVTVLREVIECACELTSTTRGVITTIDETGAVREFVSTGLTDRAHQRMAAWSDGLRFFTHIRDLKAPLRLTNVAEFAATHRFKSSLLPARAFIGVPLRHHGVHVGNFYLGAKSARGSFDQEDEETLIRFAEPAAAAIVNARAHREERNSRANLEALINESPIGVVVFDARTRRITSLNREAHRMFYGEDNAEISTDQLVDEVTCTLSDGRKIELDQIPTLHDAANATHGRDEEIEFSLPNDRRAAALVKVTPVKFKESETDTVVLTMQDLKPLHDLERVHASILDVVCHELRAPLAGIIGSTVSLNDTVETLNQAEIRAFLRIIDEQVERMRGLIADLLDAGRIESGAISITTEPTEVTELIDRAIGTFKSSGVQRAIVVDLEPNLPRVMSESRRVVQVLVNLFNNAARQIDDDSPIEVRAALDGSHVAITVYDEGKGIAPAQMVHLFSKHANLGDRGLGGGLGLAICKGLVEAHGGQIWAESDGLGQGATFTFTLPVASDVFEEAIVRDDSLQSNLNSSARILVVDDDPQALLFMREALSEAGYKVWTTWDHRELRRLIEREQIDLVLLDLVLPDADGIDLMQNHHELSALPVIIVSAYGRDVAIAQALDAGAADYIVKPFSPTELLARVRAALRRRLGVQPFVSGKLTIYFDERRVTVADVPVELTAREFDLLRTLALSAGQVLTYETLLHRVWGNRGNADRVRAFVKQLRRKLGDDVSNPVWIFNQRGVGYRMTRATDS